MPSQALRDSRGLRPHTPLIAFGLALLTLCGCASKDKSADKLSPDRRLEFTYSQLQMRDLDAIRILVSKRLGEGDRIITRDPGEVDEAIFHYQKALRVLFSRPDQDDARSLLFGEIRKRLSEVHGTDRVLQELTDEAIAAIRSSEAKPLEKATYVYVLENLMAEIRPDLSSNANYRDLLVQIRDARLVLSPEVRKSNFIQSLNPLISPSKTAEAMLKKFGGASR